MAGLPKLPFARRDVLGVAPAYEELRAKEPISKVITETGDEAWLVTGYAEIRQVFGDARFGRSHPNPASAPRLSNNALIGGPTGDYDTERVSHEAMRRLLTPAFSARRMRRLTERVQEITDDLLNRMAQAGPPADLHASLSMPLPMQVICELLGVPYEDREEFRALSDDMVDIRDRDRSAAGRTAMGEYTFAIVQEKRKNPGEDLFSDLAAASLPEDQIANIAGGLLFAGHETTVNQIDYGTLLFLRNPAQLEALMNDPSLVDGAVEEIMRMAAPSQHGLVRYPKEDVEIGGVAIRAGEAVALSIVAANRDPSVYPEAERFDIRREQSEPHVGFGYGPHYCLGANLARVELRAVFASLFERFPGLTLAVPYDDLVVQVDRLTGGIGAFPVTW